MSKKILYIFIAFFFLANLPAIAGGEIQGSGIFEAIILYQNTPNPTSDKTLIRLYLPENDPGAALRVLGTDGPTLVKEIPLGSLTGINGTPLNVSDWANGNYTIQLFYKGEVRDSHTLIVKH